MFPQNSSRIASVELKKQTFKAVQSFNRLFPIITIMFPQNSSRIASVELEKQTFNFLIIVFPGCTLRYILLRQVTMVSTFQPPPLQRNSKKDTELKAGAKNWKSEIGGLKRILKSPKIEHQSNDNGSNILSHHFWRRAQKEDTEWMWEEHENETVTQRRWSTSQNFPKWTIKVTNMVSAFSTSPLWKSSKTFRGREWKKA